MLTLVASLLTAPLALTEPPRSHGNTIPWRRGRAELASVGALAFGPEGVLFAADPRAAELYALDTSPSEHQGAKAAPELPQALSAIAAALGTEVGDVAIQDLAIHPITGKAFLSVHRGVGPDAIPVILCVGDEGEIEEFSLENVRHMSVRFDNVPEDRTDGRRNRRLESITDLLYQDGKVLIAGLSNEEFASKLRAIDYPFAMEDDAASGTSVEIYHGAHGAWETRAPVRTFVPFEIDGENHLLAAYTCTPLVKFPMSVFDAKKSQKKVVGHTVAELGSGNAPLDMEVYEQEGERFLLITNSRRGVMKVSTSGIAKIDAITERVASGRTAGVEYETIEYLVGVEQLAKLDEESFVVLMREKDAKEPSLVTIEAP